MVDREDGVQRVQRARPDVAEDDPERRQREGAYASSAPSISHASALRSCFLLSALCLSLVLFLQLLLEHLARRVARQLLHEDHLARDLEPGEVCLDLLLDLVL